MIDTYAFQQLQNYIAEMKQRHEEELRKLKAHHDRLKAHARRPQGNELYAHTLPERTQWESHPWRIVNTSYDLSLFHMHRPTGRTTRRLLFVNHIMEAIISLGCKSLNLEWYDGTIDPYEHLDAFWLRKIYTPMMMGSYVVSSQCP